MLTYLYIYCLYPCYIYIDKLSFQHHRIKFPASTHLQQTKKTVWELSAPVWPDRRRTGPGETVDFRTCIPKAIAHGHVAPWQTYRVEKKKQQLEVLFRNLKKKRFVDCKVFFQRLPKCNWCSSVLKARESLFLGRRLCGKRNDAISTSMVPAKVDKFVLSLCLR